MNRQKLLEAAARVYAESGFRGATTRRIAEEAGVNEVTLFRLFGSKAQLIAESMKCMDPMGEVELPATPRDPRAELATWCRGHLAAMTTHRSTIRKTLADIDEHPEMIPFVCDEQTNHFNRLIAYAERLAPPASEGERADLRAACTMLFGALFAYAMGTDIIPSVYPSSEADTADRYVRVFLRSLGVADVDGASPYVAADEEVARAES